MAALRRSRPTSGRHAAPPEEPQPTGDVEQANGTEGAPLAAPRQARQSTTSPDWMKLGDLLVNNRKVSAKQVAEALLQQSASGKPLGRLLVEIGALDERDLAATLAEQMSLALVDLSQETPEPEAVQSVPESLARSHNVVPMMKVDGTLVVAVSEPSPQLHEQLRTAAGMPVTLVVAPASEIRRAIDASYRALTDIESFVTAFQQAESGRTRQTAARAEATIAASEDAPIVQLVNKILTQALRDRASDVHIEPQDDRVRVRFRIDGALHDVLALPNDMAPALVSRIKIMASMNIVERRRPQDGQLQINIDGRDVDVRVATVGVHWG